MATPIFKTEEAAIEWMEEHVDDPCIDNHRVAYHVDQASMDEYQEIRDAGCCGFFDTTVIIDGQLAEIGCNYGH